MYVVGITGSIAMGKSTIATMLAKMGVPVHDADKSVHDLFKKGGEAIPLIQTVFPETITPIGVNRRLLSQVVFNEPAKLTQLEDIVHPLVAKKRKEFLHLNKRNKVRLVALDVPLLFETGGGAYCTNVLVVTAPRYLQHRRALARPGMTEAKLKAILARQVPDFEKRKRADYVVPTGLGRAYSQKVLRRVLNAIKENAIKNTNRRRS